MPKLEAEVANRAGARQSKAVVRPFRGLTSAALSGFVWSHQSPSAIVAPVVQAGRGKGELSPGVRPIERPASARPDSHRSAVAAGVCSRLLPSFNRREIRVLRSQRRRLPLPLPQLALPQQQERRMRHQQQLGRQRQVLRRQ